MRAARHFEVPPERIDLAFNKAFVVDAPGREMPIAELIRMCASEGIHRSELSIFRAPFTDLLDPETGQGQAHPDYCFGAHALEAAVDIETVEATLRKSDAATDVGQCTNRTAVEWPTKGR